MNKEKKILAGITQENELYFLEIDTTNNKRNGYDEFSMSGFTVSPVELEKAQEQSREGIRSLIEDETAKINPLFLRNIDEIVDEIIESDGNMTGIDTSLFDESVEVDGIEYVFESGACGQHEENNLKHYFIPQNQFTSIVKLWNKYHLKATPTSGEDKKTLDDALAIHQNISSLAVDAVKIINQ